MKKKLRIVLAALLLLAGCVYLLDDSGRLTVRRYTVTAPVAESIRIVHLTDLHNARFGENNSRLVELVQAQSPDLIFMTGDMLNREDRDLGTVTDLIGGLCETAPVFYGYGNHETDWEDTWQESLRTPLEAAGAVVLDNGFTDLTVKGTQLRIGGYMGYYGQPHMISSDPALWQQDRVFYQAFEDTGACKILLNHIPTQWVDWGYTDTRPVDLIFCGHYHGGLVRLPLLDRGLYAPYVGWFPPRTRGVYAGTEGTCVLSAGLGSEYPIPRLNNPPEIVVVDLIPA